jgi:hypothetical protein
MTGASKPVGFRLTRHHAELLGRRATELHTTPGALARQFVIEGLTDAGRDRVADEVRELRALVAGLRRDLATATVALLADAGKASAEEAEEFVRANLGK